MDKLIAVFGTLVVGVVFVLSFLVREIGWIILASLGCILFCGTLFLLYILVLSVVQIIMGKDHNVLDGDDY